MYNSNVRVVYDLYGIIGSGGFADVHLARRRDTGSYFAVKMPRESWDPRACQRFAQEARRQIQAQGTNVVRIIDHNLDAPKPFIVQEYMPGGSLEERLEQDRKAGKLPWAVCCALKAMAEVAEALADVHTHGYAHRDVKPGNLLYDDATKRWKLNDFGCAATVVAGQVVTKNYCGTPAYAAPEHATNPSPKVDVYALGVMLYELLVGQRLPLHWQQQGILWPTQVHTCGVTVEVDNLIRRLAHANPLHRPTALEAARMMYAARTRYLNRV